MAKIIELVSNDYYANSNDHVVLPDGMDLKVEKLAYGTWYGDIYCVEFQSGLKPKYMTFFEWLLSRGGRKPTNEELETFGE
jgi:hypothetical protein